MSLTHLSLSPNFSKCKSGHVEDLEKNGVSLKPKELRHPLIDVEYNDKENSETSATARSKLSFVNEGMLQTRIRPHTTGGSSSVANSYASNTNPILEGLDDAQTRKFLTGPVDKELWVRCNIERKLLDKKVVKFYMTLAENNKFLLCVIKRPKKSYHIYMTLDAFAKDKYFLGKLKSNFFGTEFCTFDCGSKPKKEKNKDLHRSNIAVITYVNVFIIYLFL